MRILLVQPTTKYPDLKPLRSKTRWLEGITLPYLAGLTSKGIQVDLADDRLAPSRTTGTMTWWGSPPPAPPRNGPTKLRLSSARGSMRMNRETRLVTRQAP